jgi:hypothetical protein
MSKLIVFDLAGDRVERSGISRGHFPWEKVKKGKKPSPERPMGIQIDSLRHWV